jgi:hypothetical protein
MSARCSDRSAPASEPPEDFNMTLSSVSKLGGPVTGNRGDALGVGQNPGATPTGRTSKLGMMQCHKACHPSTGHLF